MIITHDFYYESCTLCREQVLLEPETESEHGGENPPFPHKPTCPDYVIPTREQIEFRHERITKEIFYQDEIRNLVMKFGKECSCI